MYISTDLLKKALYPYSIELSEEQLDKFDEFAYVLAEENKRINLTALTSPEDIAIKHFADSLALLRYAEVPQNSTLADVGTGAGFPGLALAIVRPDLSVTLFDSTKKKLAFVDSIIHRFSLNAKTVHLRAEEAGQEKSCREKFDTATARAVAELNILAELCVPLVKIGGIFCPMKGALSEEELTNGKRALGVLGAKTEKIEKYNLTTGDARTIITAKKISQTPTRFPRSFSGIKKNPL